MEATCEFKILSGNVPERNKEFHQKPYYSDVCGMEV